MTAELVKPTNTVTKPAITAESEISLTKSLMADMPGYLCFGWVELCRIFDFSVSADFSGQSMIER